MDQRTVMAGIMLVVALATAGCASGSGGMGKKKVGVTGAKMCQAHGGTYNPVTKACSYTASTKSMREACAAQGGAFDDAADFCDMDPM